MMTDTTAVAASAPRVAATASMADLRRVVAASTVGSAMEWYDFSIYGTASALIFADLRSTFCIGLLPTSDMVGV